MGIKIVDKREENKTTLRRQEDAEKFLSYLKTHKYIVGHPTTPAMMSIIGMCVYKRNRIFPLPKYQYRGSYNRTGNDITIETFDIELVELVKKYNESNPEIEFTVTIRAEERK